MWETLCRNKNLSIMSLGIILHRFGTQNCFKATSRSSNNKNHFLHSVKHLAEFLKLKLVKTCVKCDLYLILPTDTKKILHFEEKLPVGYYNKFHKCGCDFETFCNFFYIIGNISKWWFVFQTTSSYFQCDYVIKITL